MIIGLDIDDTITDTFGVILAYAEKYLIEDLHREISVDYVTDVANTEYVQEAHKMSREDENNMFKKYFRNMARETTPYFFAAEIINKLREEGHKIFFITARHDELLDDGIWNAREETENWLKKHDIHYDKLIINAKNKGEVAKENNVDVFVDDSLDNCISVANKGIKTYIMDNRCNNKANSDKVTRVYTWPHLEHEIRREII